MSSKIVNSVIVLAVLALIIGAQTIFVVDETKQAIILQFGNPVAIYQNPGLYAKLPMVQTVTYFDKRVLSSDATPQEYLTAGKKRLVVDHVTRWRITDPLLFFKAVRTEAGARARLDDIVFSEIRRELATSNFEAVVSIERENIMGRVTISASKNAAEFGIEVVDVRIKRADLPEEVEQSVFNRMRAERQRESSLFRAEGEEQANIIRAKADRDSTVILAEGYQISQALRGEGEAEAIAIYAAALGEDLEFYAFSRRLDSYAKILKPGDSLVIPADSDFFRYLQTSNVPVANP
ncbi:MAG: protease modulator HflC [Caldilineaceae bacterium]|nr:protease modulator HflC [Caldilineaceae bacterium]MBP8109427.1 protease modulator HflC [Caldilineaceae bacterium]MBP8121879.1 protease modulator HflC [Caldilineaceae bacterium]MBP9073156.1 protease modulator HflC [Caldilineaceae bacterium]